MSDILWKPHQIPAEQEQPQDSEKLFSEIRYRTLIEQFPLSTQIFSPDGNTVLVNRAWERLWGVTLDQIAGYNILEDEQLVAKGVMPDIQRAFAGEATAIPAIKYEPDKTLPDLSSVPYRWVRAFIYPVKDEVGNIREVVLIHEDITASKQVEEQLRHSRDQLNIILQNVADGITVQDITGEVIYVNDPGARLCGFSSAQEMLAQDTQTIRIRVLQRFEMRDEAGQPLSFTQLPAFKALQGEGYAETLVNYIDKQAGTSSWSMLKTSPIFDEKGQVQFAVNIFSDVTERKELERRKDEFITMASHELKTPVTTIKGYTQVLQRRFKSRNDEESSHFLSIMDRQLNKLTSLINDLLDISKIQTGKLAFQEEVFDLAELVQETVENLQATTQSHQLVLEATTSARVFGDRDRVGQVLINLLTNAIKYSPQADKVLIRISKDSEYATVSVQDFGIGIPEGHHQRIFERFYQVADPMKSTFPGLGIGLYISSEIIQRHRGRIWVESRKEEGSTFSFTIPLQKK